MLSGISGCVLLCLGIIVVVFYVELILEINKTVIVASSWSSIITLIVLLFRNNKEPCLLLEFSIQIDETVPY
jgi:hypothetical protein